MMTTLRYTQLTLMHKCALDANAILLLIRSLDHTLLHHRFSFEI